MTKKNTIEKPPECWIDKQVTKPKKKLYGIWAKYDTATKSRIEKECSHAQEKKRKGAKKRK